MSKPFIALVWVFALFAISSCFMREERVSLQTIELEYRLALHGNPVPYVESQRRRGYVCKVHGRLTSLKVFVFADSMKRTARDERVEDFLSSYLATGQQASIIWLSNSTGCIMSAKYEAVCSTAYFVESCKLITNHFAEYKSKL